jgi:hypothetical protein
VASTPWPAPVVWCRRNRSSRRANPTSSTWHAPQYAAKGGAAFVDKEAHVTALVLAALAAAA